MLNESNQLRIVVAAEAQLAEFGRPSVMYRPELSQDGDAWIALYGRDLAVGVVGTGSTPAEAMAAFDRAWFEKARVPALAAKEDGRG